MSKTTNGSVNAVLNNSESIGDELVRPFYALSSTDDALATCQRHINKAEYDLYADLVVNQDGLEAPDVAALIAVFASRIAKTYEHVQSRLEALEMLQHLPKTQELVFSDYIIDLTRLHFLLLHTKALDPSLYPRLDEELFNYLEPTHPMQDLPGLSTLRNKAKRIVNELQPIPESPPKPSSEEHVYFSEPMVPGAIGGYCEMALGKFRHHLLEETLTAISKKYGCELPEAVERLCTDNADVKITLHLFQSKTGNAVTGHNLEFPAHHNQGPLSRATVVDDTVPAPSRNGYQFSEKQRWQIRGRDGTCRFPGCTRSAWYTDIDHVVPYADNGATDINNAQCLCRRHHNLKTRRIVSCEMNPETYAVKWIMPDGTIIYTHPQGPMAPPLQKTVMTLSQLRGQHCARAAAERARQARENLEAQQPTAEQLNEAHEEVLTKALDEYEFPF